MLRTAPPPRDPYRLSASLAALNPPTERFPVRDPSDMLRAFVGGCDKHGRYHGDPHIMRLLFWWQDTPVPIVQAWRDQLVEWGDLELRPDAINCYSPDGEPFDVAYLVDRRRFRRFRARRPIPADVRRLIYERDDYRCVTCGTADRLTLDHIHPWSRGGEDHPDNLQTLCQPCNSAKGARVS